MFRLPPRPEFPACQLVLLGYRKLTVLDVAQLGQTREDVVVFPDVLDHGVHNLVVGRACDRGGRLGAEPRARVSVVRDEGGALLAPTGAS